MLGMNAVGRVLSTKISLNLRIHGRYDLLLSFLVSSRSEYTPNIHCDSFKQFAEIFVNIVLSY